MVGTHTIYKVRVAGVHMVMVTNLVPKPYNMTTMTTRTTMTRLGLGRISSRWEAFRSKTLF